MSQPGFTVTVDTPVDDAVGLMGWHLIHGLVVVADDGESAIGVLSATDLVRGLADNAVDRGT